MYDILLNIYKEEHKSQSLTHLPSNHLTLIQNHLIELQSEIISAPSRDLRNQAKSTHGTISLLFHKIHTIRLKKIIKKATVSSLTSIPHNFNEFMLHNESNLFLKLHNTLHDHNEELKNILEVPE